MTTSLVLDKAGTQRPVPIHGPDAFAGMRRAGQLAAATLDHITAFVRPGVSTGAIDREIDAFMRSHGGIPATLGYKGFPKSCCTSVNHVVNHGIPTDKKILQNGDILNIDVTVILEKWHGDTSRMYYVGKKTPVKARLLVERTYEAMWAGINVVRPGATLDDVGEAIQIVAETKRFGVGFSVVRDFVGHGVGREFHAPPEVKHFYDREKPNDLMLVPGMIFTIEPMINAGESGVEISKFDGWTTITKDGSLSAQFEHTVGVTADGVEVFTRSPAGFEKPPYQV